MTDADPRPIHEYRRYTAAPGKMPALLARFENMTFKCFATHDIKVVAFWETYVGESSQIHYVLEWKDLEDRRLRWDRFATDPEWIAYRNETEKNGPLTVNVHNELWRLARFSPKLG